MNMEFNTTRTNRHWSPIWRVTENLHTVQDQAEQGEFRLTIAEKKCLKNFEKDRIGGIAM